MTKTIRNSKIFEINQPYLYALIRKAFLFLVTFGIFEKSIFFMVFENVQFRVKNFAWGCICLYKNSFIHQKEFLSRFRLRKGDSRSMTHIMSHSPSSSTFAYVKSCILSKNQISSFHPVLYHLSQPGAQLSRDPCRLKIATVIGQMPVICHFWLVDATSQSELR